MEQNSNINFTYPYSMERDEKGMKFVPSFMVPLLFIAIMIMVSLCVVAIFLLAAHQYIPCIVCFVLAICLGIFGRICDNMEWHRNVKYHFERDQFLYFYDLDKNVIPTSNPRVKYTIKDIKSVKITSRFIIVKGDVVKHAPLTPPKQMSSVKLSDIPEKHSDLLNFINHYKVAV